MPAKVEELVAEQVEVGAAPCGGWVVMRAGRTPPPPAPPAQEVEDDVEDELSSDDDDDDVPDLEGAEGEGGAAREPHPPPCSMPALRGGAPPWHAGEEGERRGGKQSRSEKKSRKAMQKLGMKPVPNVLRVQIKKSKNVGAGGRRLHVGRHGGGRARSGCS